MNINTNTNTSDAYIASLGEQLERNRLLQNISQADLAQKAGISTRTLRRIESGQGGSMDSFVRLLIGLGIDNNLSVLIPDPSVRPMERSRHAKTERMRASRSTSSLDKTTQASNDKSHKDKAMSERNTGWVWGDEQS